MDRVSSTKMQSTNIALTLKFKLSSWLYLLYYKRKNYKAFNFSCLYKSPHYSIIVFGKKQRQVNFTSKDNHGPYKTHLNAYIYIIYGYGMKTVINYIRLDSFRQ